MKKKIISIVCALALIGTMTAALTACDVKGGGGNAAKVKVNANDVYALSALTGAEYLAQTESGATGAAETTRPGGNNPSRRHNRRGRKRHQRLS